MSGNASTGLVARKPPVEDELQVGDLVMYVGKVTEHMPLHRRCIYKVVRKRHPEDAQHVATYHFRPVFDFENPLGQSLDMIGWSTLRDLRKLSLVDLGTLRLHFDNFIREWARQVGHDNADEAL